jgi:hypothetical protein
MDARPLRLMPLIVAWWVAVVFSGGVASAQAPGRSVPVSELIGLQPAQVRGQLADVDTGWPIQPMFEIATPDGVLSFITVDDLMLDPVLAHRLAVFRTQGEPGPWEPYTGCQTMWEGDSGPPTHGDNVVLVFRGGRLEKALAPPPADLTPPPAPTAEAIRALQRQPRTSPFIAEHGDLPLRDGAAFLSRWKRAPLPPVDRLSVACALAKPPTPIHRPPHNGLDASDMQGLALVPFAIGLPSMNHQREEARVRGHELLQSLHVGDRLSDPAERFAAQHAEVHSYVSGGGYAVLAIDLGGYPTRNLSNFRDFALVGLRDERIDWIAPPSTVGPSPTLLCLDNKGVPGTPRRGCHGYGSFSP